MAWVNISEDVHKGLFNCPSSIAADNKVWVTIQYNDATITPLQVEIRFKLNSKSSSNYYDKFFLLIGQSSSGTLLKIKNTYTSDGGGDWPYYWPSAATSTGYIIKKKYNDATFTLPAYYIIDNGNNAVTISDAAGAYSAATGSRSNYSCGIKATDLSLNTGKTVASDIHIGSTVITDNFDNSFTITATKGSNGTNNTAGGPTDLKYGYSSTTRDTKYTSGTSINLTLSGTGNTRTVYAESTTTATYGDDKKATTYTAIRQYRAPNAPGVPALTASSYKNNRLTIKKDWTFSWTAATPGTGSGTTIGTESGQTTSKVTGYRVMLYRKRPSDTSFLNIPIKNVDGSVLSNVGAGVYYYDVASNTVGIDPVACGFAAGDQVKIGIKPYTQYGERNNGNKLVRSTETFSGAVTVQNAGVVRVKPNNSVGWKEGVVWVKVKKDGTIKWVEADIVKVKTASGWQESN